MRRRAFVKWLHWLIFALILYFFIEEPEVGGPGLGDLRGEGLSIHSGMGLTLAVLTFA